MTTPMSAERFSDRFRYFRDQPQQQRGFLEQWGAESETFGMNDAGITESKTIKT
jgi:hypothetical protein